VKPKTSPLMTNSELSRPGRVGVGTLWQIGTIFFNNINAVPTGPTFPTFFGKNPYKTENVNNSGRNPAKLNSPLFIYILFFSRDSRDSWDLFDNTRKFCPDFETVSRFIPGTGS
jgi:hypothetical protein